MGGGPAIRFQRINGGKLDDDKRENSYDHLVGSGEQDEERIGSRTNAIITRDQYIWCAFETYLLSVFSEVIRTRCTLETNKKGGGQIECACEGVNLCFRVNIQYGVLYNSPIIPTYLHFSDDLTARSHANIASYCINQKAPKRQTDREIFISGRF